MRNIKKCKGFKEKPCLTCKRMDNNTSTTLVQELVNTQYGKVKYCMHYIHGKNK